jgi:phage-related protein
MVATASEKLIPFLTALGETFTTIVQPAITITKEVLDTLKVTITTIGDTVQSITETVGGVFTTAIETARDIALAVVDAVADGFDSTIELIKFLEGTTLTGAKLAGIAGGVVALAGSLLLLTGANVVGAALEGIKNVVGDAYSGFLSLFGGESDAEGESSSPLEMLRSLATLAENAPFLEKLPTILDRIAESFSNLFNRKFDINNFMDAIGALTSKTREFQEFAIDPFTTAAVGETAVGLATGAEAAGGAAMAPVINNVVTNSSAPTQIVPDSNIGSRSTDRDVFSPLDNHSPFSFAGL